MKSFPLSAKTSSLVVRLFGAVLAVVCLFGAGVSEAQTAGKQITVSGMVISSADDSALVGVSVYVEGTALGTTTNANGEYSLTVPADTKEVTFAYLGYDTKRIKAASAHLFKLVTLIEQANTMEDVVVVGFGTQKKESLVGAVQAVKPSDLTVTSSNLTTAFAGNVAGLISTQSSGEPGYDNATFYVRGVSTFGSNKSALIVLDGVEITATMLNNIPPESIESFSVLKDATATALYGSRGANGVVIVTTKEGRNSEKLKVNVTLENTFSMPTRVQDIANAADYMTLYNEAKYNDAKQTNTKYTPFYSEAQIDGARRHLNPYLFPDNDWYDMMFKDFAVNQRFNFTMRGGGQRVNYFLNASVFNENGIIRKPSETPLDVKMNNQKYLFQSNVAAYMTPTTKVSLKMNTQLWYNNTPAESTSDLFYWTMRVNPARFPAVLPAQEGDTFVRYGNNNSWDTGQNELNPYASLSSGYRNRYYSYLTSSFQVDQDLKMITKGLSAKAMISFYNYTYTTTTRKMTPFYYRVDDDYSINDDGTYNWTMSSIGAPGSTYLTSEVGHSGHREWSFQGTIDYAREFGKHDVGATLVYHMKEKVNNAIGSSEEDILPYREQGLAGRVTYSFDKRYYAEFNFGYNGSENFISGKRFGFFPSAAIGWTLSNERFFKPLKRVVDNLKIRASYGLAGNDALPDRFPYLTIVDMSGGYNYYFGSSFASPGKGGGITTYGNESATWEVAKKLNIGIDLGLFESLDLSVDYFEEKRSDIFMQRQSVPSSAGLEAQVPWGNLGKVNNRGVDMSLEFNKAFRDDLILTVRGTLTYAHNEVVAMDEPAYRYKNLSKIGHSMNAHQVLVAEGLFTSEEEIANHPTQTFGTYTVGDIKYKDVNGDNVIDSNDRVWDDTPSIPEVMYGFGATLKYRKWDFSFLFQGAGNYQIRMYNHHPFCDSSHFGYGIAQYIADDHWSELYPDANAAYPRLTSVPSDNNTQASTFYLRDAHYLRLKNAEIGFTIKNFRIYAAGSNLFTVSPFDNWDPEMGGGHGLKYPLQRTVKLGLQYQF